MILFELLVGTTPLSKDRVQATPASELSRLIRSAEAARPSKRLDETVAETETIVARRGTDRSRLRATLRRDLDWIVLKSLEKERERRYETVDALAGDLNRFLNDQPVEARPPSISYRVGKLARRYKVAFATSAAFLILIVGATIVSTLLAVRAIDAERLANHRLADVQAANATARLERNHAIEAGKTAVPETANANAVSEFVRFDLLANAAPSRFPNRNLTMREVLDRAAGRIAGRFDSQPQVEASIRTIIGNSYLRLGSYRRAEKQLKTALNLERSRSGAESRAVLNLQSSLASAYIGQSRYAEAEELLAGTIQVQQQFLSPTDPELLKSRMNLVTLYLHQRRFDKAEPSIADIREHLRKSGASTGRYPLLMLNQLAGMHYMQKHYAEAESVLRELHTTFSGKFGRKDPDTLAVAANRCAALGAQSKTNEAFKLAQETWRLQREVLGAAHPDTIKCRATLAKVCLQKRDFTATERHFKKVIAASQRTLGESHPDTIQYRHHFAALLAGQHRLAEALPQSQAAVRAARSGLGNSHRVTLEPRLVLARILTGLGRRRRASQAWKSLLADAQRALGKDDPLTRSAEMEWNAFRRRQEKATRR